MFVITMPIFSRPNLPQRNAPTGQKPSPERVPPRPASGPDRRVHCLARFRGMSGVTSCSIALSPVVGWSTEGRPLRRKGPGGAQCRSPAVRAGVDAIFVVGGSNGLRCRLRHHQRLADLGQSSSPAAIGQKAVVTDPHQPLGQDVKQEAAHELFAIKNEPFVAVTVTVILVEQGDLVVVHGEDAGVTDGDLARVACQVTDHGLGVLEAVLAVDHPLGGHQGIELVIHVTGPGDPVELAGGSRPAQGADHVTAKVAR